jgi:predicted acetyltransferase
LHDLSEIWGWLPNKYGVYEDDGTQTLNEQNKVFDIWWEKPSILYPYLIKVNGIPAGFALVATPPFTPHGSDFYMNEFFLLRPFRGRDIAENAAKEVFNNHMGSWELQTNPTEANVRAQNFWRKTIKGYAGGTYKEECSETSNDGRKLIFRFNNGSKS